MTMNDVQIGKPKTTSDYYFEDFKPGDKFTSPTFILSEQELIDFARKYDPQPYHTDPEAAAASHFGGLVAAGAQTAALVWTLVVGSGVFRACALAGLGLDGLRWLKPVRAGDALPCRFEMIETRVSSSKPGRGITVIRCDLFNQRDEIVLTTRMSQ